MMMQEGFGRQMVLRRCVWVLLVVLTSSPAMAQDISTDPAGARFHFGPLMFSPTIGLTNVGVDTNVFNDWDNPKQDFTATPMLQSDLWLPVGAALLSGKASVEYLYFQTYTHERAVNTHDALKLEIPLVHIRPYVSASYVNAQDRQGYEIDTRVRHNEGAVAVGVDVPIGGILTISVFGGTSRLRYANDAFFGGVPLAVTLNRDTDTVTASCRYNATPLTTVVVEVSAERDLFVLPDRNSDSVRVFAGFDFRPTGFLQGTARVGFRKFNIAGPHVPDFAGPVASVDVSYTISESTRVAVQIQRDITYSFSVEEPYYLLTALTFSVGQQVYGPVDVQARAGRQQLAYPSVAGAAVISVPHTEVGTTYGGGIGYLVGDTTRVGFNVDRYLRHSPIYSRDYQTLRFGATVTYGF